MPLSPLTAARRLILPLLATLTLSLAAAANLVVHPFSSEEPLLGVAVAEELAASFRENATVFGPEVAAGIVPPLVVVDGFINLGRVLTAKEWTGPAGADLLRSGSGADVAVTGELLQYHERTVLRLEVAYSGGSRRAELSASPGDRGRLVRQAVRLIAPHLILEGGSPAPLEGPELRGDYEAYMNAVLLAASGLIPEAAEVKPDGDGSWPARGAEFMEDLRSVIDGDPTALMGEETGAAPHAAGRRLARRAMLSLSLPTFPEAEVIDAWREAFTLSRLPVSLAWVGVLAADAGDRDSASEAFARARRNGLQYAAALTASLELAHGESNAALEIIDDLTAEGPSAGSAALLGASLVAVLAGDYERQATTLHALTRSAPYLTYPYQELSFKAFDDDDALAAAKALTVAVELDPHSTLYWTNLGWARYLLGELAGSEEASKRALALNSGEYIAAYNLGLVRVVTGRLAAALEAYDHAVSLDPAVHDDALEDLRNARALYPRAHGVEYALARLYEVKGSRAKARDAYRRFVSLTQAARETDAYGEFIETAKERLLVLSAPPPPLEISGGITASLGKRGSDAQPFSPGDPLHVTFELSTPGEELPALVNVTLTLSVGEETLLKEHAQVEPPPGAVGYVIDTLKLDLPTDLKAGSYALNVEVTAGEELTTDAATDLQVEGGPQPLRQLLGRGVVMTGLEIEAALYTFEDLGNEERVVRRMLAELEDAAPAAEEALPRIESGRFEGLSGGELFASATAANVREFLSYVAATGVTSSRFAFVDGYAQWAIEGAPATGENGD